MTDKNHSVTGILEEMTIEEVRALAPEVAVVGIGSTEPHGPHLPYGTDTYQVNAVCRAGVTEANQAGGRVVMYPTLPVSNNVNFQAFPFACRIGVRTLMTVIADIVGALEQDGVRKVVLVNGHGGNPDTLQAAIREHVSKHAPGEGSFLCMVSAGGFVPREVARTIEHPSDHAGESETSRMLYLRPDLVRQEHLAEFPVQKPMLEQLANGQVFYVRPWHGYLPESAGGETRASTAEKGRALTESGAHGLAQFLVDLTHAALHDRFPYPPMTTEPAMAEVVSSSDNGKHAPKR